MRHYEEGQRIKRYRSPQRGREGQGESGRRLRFMQTTALLAVKSSVLSHEATTADTTHTEGEQQETGLKWKDARAYLIYYQMEEWPC